MEGTRTRTPQNQIDTGSRRLVKLNTSQGFVGSVRLSEYRQVNREYRLREHLGSPYVFLSMGELGRLKLWADRKHIDAGKILCIFEDGDKGQSDLLKRARADEFNAIPQSKKDTRAFDSCDLAAWKGRALIDDAWERNLHSNDPEAAGRIMKTIGQLESVVRGKEVGMYSAHALRRICKLMDVPRRK